MHSFYGRAGGTGGAPAPRQPTPLRVRPAQEAPRTTPQNTLQRSHATASQNFYGGRADADRQEDGQHRLPVHMEVHRELLACTAVEEVWRQLERRRTEMDAANFATALQRIAKTCGYAGAAGPQALLDRLFLDISSRMDEFSPFNLTTISWAMARMAI